MYIHYSNAPCGSGKTINVINKISSEDRVVMSVPTKDLCDSISSMFKLFREDINTVTIHGDVTNKVGADILTTINNYNSMNSDYEALGMKGGDGVVLIITHQSLRTIPFENTEEWDLIIDEVPDVSMNRSSHVSSDYYNRLLSDFFDIDDQNKMTIKSEVDVEDIVDLYKEAKRSQVTPSEIAFNAVLNKDTCHLEWVSDTLKCIGYYDYTKVFQSFNEVHVLGNNIQKSLFHLLLISKGYTPVESKYSPEFNGYKLPPVLVPLVAGDRFSKEIMFTNTTGKRNNRFDESTFGWQLMKRSFDYHSGERVLFHGMSWMKPFFKKEHYPNVTVIPFDVRGMNNYRTYHRTSHIMHGNDSPHEKEMNERMLEMMGVGECEGMQAIRHMRLVEPITQAMLRTEMRNLDEQENQVIAIVPTMELAKQIAEHLNVECVIDDSIMCRPPERISDAKERKEEKIRKAISLYNTGMKKVEVCKELNISRPTLNKWLTNAA